MNKLPIKPVPAVVAKVPETKQETIIPASLTFKAHYVPNCTLMLPTGKRVMFLNYLYTAESEYEASLIEANYSNMCRRA
jgi:hypothetical protein